MQATLYLIPTTLSDAPLSRVLPEYNAEIIRSIKVFIVENLRTARRFLKQVDKSINIDELQFFELNEHTDRAQIETFLVPLAKGCDTGVISEAGCPAVADPGADVVAIAQRKGFTVSPLVGPSSILLSLMASGFNGQTFAFNGYLPVEPSARAARIKALEHRVYAEDQTQIFIETPYRNAQMLASLCNALRPTTRICVACDLTAENQFARTLTAKEWSARLDKTNIHKRPCIFLIYK